MQRIIYIVYILLSINISHAAIISGNPNGNITLDFVYDYQCNYCHKIWPEIKKIEEQNSNIKIKLHPIFAINNTSLIQAASMIHLALSSDVFFELNDYLLTSKPINDYEFKQLVSRHINVDKNFLISIRSKKVKEQIDEGIEILTSNNTENVPFIIITGKNGATTTLQGYQEYSKILREIKNAS